MLEQFFNGKMIGGGSLVLEDLNVTSHTTQSHTYISRTVAAAAGTLTSSLTLQLY